MLSPIGVTAAIKADVQKAFQRTSRRIIVLPLGWWNEAGSNHKQQEYAQLFADVGVDVSKWNSSSSFNLLHGWMAKVGNKTPLLTV